MLRLNVILGIFLRNVQSYFSGILGYLIIVAFVTVCALLAFSQQFFANNDASLDQLSAVYPWLLLFLVPAITMGAWANEHKSGTDVLLFTLPASNWEILLGKYLAVAAVYTIALLFSVTQLVALRFLGQPDWSMVLSTYYGYWLSGLALLSIGLFASSLTRDAAAAFVLGMLMCAVPVLGSYFVQGQPLLFDLSVQSHLERFASGVVYLKSLWYFGGILILFLYLNHVVISQRLWVRLGQQFMLTNYGVRSIALASFLAAAYFLVGRMGSLFPAYLDLTADKFYTLDKTTIQAIDNIRQSGATVTIEAYISEEVPADYVGVKKQLETLLSQYDQAGGGAVQVVYNYLAPFSPSEIKADEAGIEGNLIEEKVAGRTVQQKVYLGVVIRTAEGEPVLPAFDGTTAIEYEITRAIASHAGPEQQLTVGVLETDMHLMGLEIQGEGIDLEFGKINRELKKFYKMKRVASSDLMGWVKPTEETDEATQKKAPDVLMVPGVSSLDQDTMDALVQYVKQGKPVLIMDDPVPFYFPTYMWQGQMGMLRGPAQERFSPGSQPAQLFNSSSAPKASLDGLKAALGIRWNPTRIVWNSTMAPDSFVFPMQSITNTPVAWPDGFGSRQNALVFFRSEQNETDQQINPDVPAVSGLHDLMFVYAGTFEKAADSPFQFVPWISTSLDSGTLEYEQYSEVEQVRAQVWDSQLNRPVIEMTDSVNPWTRQPDRILKKVAGSVPEDPQPFPVVAQILGTESEPRNVVLISDLDFLSDLAFDCSDAMPKGLENVALLQNAIETLANDDRFIELRSRRPRLRPLERIDQVKKLARKERLAKQEELETKLREKLADAQKQLDAKAAEIQADQDLSIIQRLQMAATAASEEQGRLDREMKKARKDFDQEIRNLEVAEKTVIDNTENRTRFFAVLLPPLPALAMGIAVMLVGLVKQSRARR